MVGGPGVREDVAMTRSGGRKRAARKVSESSRKKMQDRAKPTHLDFQYEAAAVTKEQAKLGSSRDLVVTNKSNSGDEARGRKGKAGLKKMLGKVPRALGFGKNISRRVSVSPTLGDISEVSASGFQKRRASSILGAGGKKRRKVPQNSGKDNQSGARGDPGQNSNSVTVKVGSRVSSPKKVKASHQEKLGVDGQDEIQGDCEEEMMVEVNPQEEIGLDSGSKNQPSPTSQSCRPLDGGDEEQEEEEGRRHQGKKGSAARSGDGKSIGNSSQGAASRLQQEMSEQESAGLSFLRLANPLIGVLLRASANLRELGHHDKLEEGWMAVKKALEQDHD